MQNVKRRICFITFNKIQLVRCGWKLQKYEQKMSYFRYKIVSKSPVLFCFVFYFPREWGGRYYLLANITQSSPILEPSNIAHFSAVSGQVVRGRAVLRQLRVASGPLLGGAVRPPQRPGQHPAGVAAGAVSKHGQTGVVSIYCWFITAESTLDCSVQTWVWLRVDLWVEWFSVLAMSWFKWKVWITPLRRRGWRNGECRRGLSSWC